MFIDRRNLEIRMWNIKSWLSIVVAYFLTRCLTLSIPAMKRVLAAIRDTQRLSRTTAWWDLTSLKQQRQICYILLRSTSCIVISMHRFSSHAQAHEKLVVVRAVMINCVSLSLLIWHRANNDEVQLGIYGHDIKISDSENQNLFDRLSSSRAD